MSAIGKSKPRVSHACRQCKKRKLKCDLGRPDCGRCAATPGVRCHYEVEIPGLRGYQYIPTPAASDDSRRLKRGSEDSEGITIPLERLESIERRLQTLTGLVHALQTSVSNEKLPSRAAGNAQPSTRQVSDTASGVAGVKKSAGHLDVQADG